MDDLTPLADQSFCCVTTTGRRSGNPHEIEIWFGWAEGMTIYMLAGGGDRADWVRNMRANPNVTVRIADRTFNGAARDVKDTEEEALARRLLASEYQNWHEGTEMSAWAQTALPIAIELKATA